MKKFIQLILFLFLIIISIIFYKIYFDNTKEPATVSKIQNDNSLTNTENNLIKNLKYEIKLNQDNQYIITSDLSEITYENNIEIVKMQNVEAIFIDQTNIPIIVTSDQAIYNNSSYNTKFNKNVKIKYLDNLILSDYMGLDFNNNLITINKNVKYNGLQGTILADNVKIDLITKKIEIYMDDTKDNVEIATK
tara:strand:+ start:1531 stop:2106 length:576 start_codon:yes stop_codon:yes gene_type:complete